MIPNFGNGPENPPTTFAIDKEGLQKCLYNAALPEVSPLGCLDVKPRWEDYYLGDIASCKFINLRVQVW